MNLLLNFTLLIKYFVRNTSELFPRLKTVEQVFVRKNGQIIAGFKNSTAVALHPAITSLVSIPILF